VREASGETNPPGTALIECLEEARRRGFLGSGAVEDQVRHAVSFAAVVGEEPRLFVDLGTGGGVPGLVLGLSWRDAAALLVEAKRARARFLREWVERLDLGGRARVIEDRAEAVARAPEFRHQADAVVARGFGVPPIAAECAAGLLRPGGLLVVSEPPGAPQQVRWPDAGLRQLGFGPAEWTRAGGFSFARMRLERGSDDWPRAVGRPQRRPLW